MLGGRICFAEECSTTLSDCFKKTIPDLEAGDDRLQKYEDEAKQYLKSVNKSKKLEGLTFGNKSVLLKGWTVVDKATRNGKNAVVLANVSGGKFVLTWSESRSFDPKLSGVCAQNEPNEFLTGETYTHKEISSGIVVVEECGIKSVLDAVRK
jgi:hypothetical protein